MIPKKYKLTNSRGDVMPLNSNGEQGLFVLNPSSGYGVSIKYDVDNYQASQIIKNSTLNMEPFKIDIKIGMNYSAKTQRAIYNGLVQFLNYTPYVLNVEDDTGSYNRDVQIQTMTLTDLKEGQIFEESLEFICTSLWYTVDTYTYEPKDVTVLDGVGKVFGATSTASKGYVYGIQQPLTIAPTQIGSGGVTCDELKVGSSSITGFVSIPNVSTFRLVIDGVGISVGGTLNPDGTFSYYIDPTKYNWNSKVEIRALDSNNAILDRGSVPVTGNQYGYAYNVDARTFNGLFNISNDSVYFGLTDGSPCVISMIDTVNGLTNPTWSVIQNGVTIANDRYATTIPKEYALRISSIDGKAEAVRVSQSTGAVENIYQTQDQTMTNFVKIPIGDSQLRFNSLTSTSKGLNIKVEVRRERISIG